MASIDIAQMRALVSALVTARPRIEGRRRSVAGELATVDVSGEPLLRLFAVEGWIDEQLPGVRRRLALAEAIEAQTPGLGGVVTVDEAWLSTATVEEARELARRAAELIRAYGEQTSSEDISQELLDLLAENALDPYFAHELARSTTPDEIATVVRYAAYFRRDVAFLPQDPSVVADADARYEALLSGLGESLGLASRGTDDLRLPNSWREGWVATMSDLEERDLPLAAVRSAALSLVMSRGTWSTVLLHEVAGGLYGVELAYGPDAWSGMVVSQIVAPGGDPYTDPLAGVLAAVASDPDAAQWLFDDSTVGTATVGGAEIALGGFLEHCLRRQWPSDGGAAFFAALGTATTPFEGGSTVSADIATQARSLVEQLTAEYEATQAEAEANDHGWFSTLGHVVLDLLGLVPLVGEPADGVNAVWYTAEGNFVDAGLSAAGLIPVIGWAAVGGKWTRRALNADELLTIGRRLDGLAINSSTVRVARGAPTGGVFRQQKPQWLQRMLDGKQFEAPILDDVLQQGGATQVRALQQQVDELGRPVFDAAGAAVYRSSYPYNVVDGYLPGVEIIEVKHTQFAGVTEAHGLSQVRALANKYPAGAPIATVPSGPPDLVGQPLRGTQVLVVPVQSAPIPQRILDEADRLGVIIRDSSGRVYP